jgi:hypothetical protein
MMQFDRTSREAKVDLCALAKARLEIYRALRDEWSDELPVELVHDGNYKCRSCFIMILQMKFATDEKKGLFNSEILEEGIRPFREHKFAPSRGPGSRNTVEDIQIMNIALEKVIEFLQDFAKL